MIGLTDITGLHAAQAVLAMVDDGAQASGHVGNTAAQVQVEQGWAVLAIVALPMLSFVLCGVYAALGIRSKLPAWTTVGLLAVSFALTLMTFLSAHGPSAADGAHAPWYAIVHGFEWVNFSWGLATTDRFVADFSFYLDGLTLLWMLFVTGLGAVIALYASEYMSHDVGLGYCRFFAAFSLFVFSMACLVMADNLLLLFLGWEGVGLCSYLLIGYFYKKAPAVAAAKKAFIMNRIGDLGLILGIMGTYVTFGTVELEPLFAQLATGKDAAGNALADSPVSVWLPALFMIGAFGKSAQLFFYVWLPDAMEGPTPVSALIHAATMVTAGVYLIARMFPLFTADDDLLILTIVAWAGGITAFWAATIEMAIFDIKRVMGYSTISQLGYMFAGLGLLTPVGASFHTFTHAFFKASLFLGVGAVMHGFGGQLDLRRLSGVAWMRGFGLVGLVMLIGSINLSGVPFTAGYFSKDMILAQAFTTPETSIAGASALGWLLLLTAGMTAYYSFRTYFRVYLGPKEFIPGDDPELLDLGRHPKGTTLDQWHAEHGHGHGHGDHGHGDHGHGGAHGHADTGSVAERRLRARMDFDPTTEEFDPHPPGPAMQLSMVICAALSVAAAGLYFMGPHGGWVASMVDQSSAAYHTPHEGGGWGFNFLGITEHKAMYVISAVVGAVGILLAWWLHLAGRTTCRMSRADELLKIPAIKTLHGWANHKWYVDELYEFLICTPLWVLSHVFHMIDKLLVDGLVNLAGWAPRGVGAAVRPSQSGILHGYAAQMAGGVAIILVIACVAAFT